MIKRFKKKAQSTAEYAILISLVVGAALAMQHEVRRALQARIHDAAEDFVYDSEGRTLQYEPQSGTKTRNTTAYQDISEIFVEDSEQEDFYTKDAGSDTTFSSNVSQ